MSKPKKDILTLPIYVFRNIREEGPAFCAVIWGNHVNPFYGATAMEAKRNADAWRKAEVERFNATFRRGAKKPQADEVSE